MSEIKSLKELIKNDPSLVYVFEALRKADAEYHPLSKKLSAIFSLTAKLYLITRYDGKELQKFATMSHEFIEKLLTCHDFHIFRNYLEKAYMGMSTLASATKGRAFFALKELAWALLHLCFCDEAHTTYPSRRDDVEEHYKAFNHIVRLLEKALNDYPELMED